MAGTYKIAHSFLFTQEVASTTWNVQHMLGYFPTVDVQVDMGTGLEKIIPGEIVQVDVNNLTITFSELQVGFARCN